MAEKNESTNEVHPGILNDFGEDLPRRFPLGKNKGEKFGAAYANKKRIIKIAQLLQAIADYDVEAKQESLQEETADRKLKRQVSMKDYLPSCLGKVIKTLDIVLVWLEQSAKHLQDEIAKKKGVKSRPRPQTDETDAGTEERVDIRTEIIEYQEKREGVLRGLYHITGIDGSLIF